MTLLDAASCAALCESLGLELGPLGREIVVLALGAALGWWKIRKVERASAAGVAHANEQATKAKTEARAAQISLARIEGSLRPAAMTPVPDAVRIDGMPGTQAIRASMPDPSLLSGEYPLPRPAGTPSEVAPTPVPPMKGGRREQSE